MSRELKVSDCRRALARAEEVVASLTARRIRRDPSVYRAHFEAAARDVLAARAALRLAEEHGRPSKVRSR